MVRPPSACWFGDCRLRRAPLHLVLCFTALLAGCDIFRLSLLPNREARGSGHGPTALPSKFSQRLSQFVFVSDFEVKVDQAPFRELSGLREHVLKELHLPAPPPSVLINVYLFEDRDRYEQFMKAHYPKLPRRRAFFVAQPRGVGSGDDLLVYTFWGDHVRQDLRHELTHAMLHSILKDVPLWLDEGLAEYFELPTEAKGVNRQHVEIIQRDGFKPDMARLEQLSEVEQMTPVEYREAWAWVHFMLRGSPEGRKVLLAYLQQLRSTSSPGALQPKLKAKLPEFNEALLAHLSKL
jgi:hypothetical protein